MQIKHLRSFVLVAEELHFGRAAARLRMTQSGLSQHIQKLEAELGVELLVRSSREIALTAAGEVLLEPALRVLASAERARAAVADHVAGHSGGIRISSLGAGMNGPLPAVLRRFRELAPAAVVDLHHSRDSVSQERALVAGTLDVAVLRRVSSRRTLVSQQLAQEAFVAFVPEEHRLAGRSEGIPLAELAEEPFVFWRRPLGTSFHDSIVNACRAHGFEPAVVAYGDTVEAQLSLVAAGMGVSLHSATNSSIRRTGTTVIPILDENIRDTLWLAYRTGPQGPMLASFLQAVAEVSGWER